jgi:hypothetical protein
MPDSGAPNQTNNFGFVFIEITPHDLAGIFTIHPRGSTRTIPKIAVS